MWASLRRFRDDVEVQFWIREDAEPGAAPRVRDSYRVLENGRVVGHFDSIHAVTVFLSDYL